MAELGYEVYQVRSGDTVENVAARFGITPRRIRLLNHLPSDTALEPGQSLAVPLALSHTQRRSEGPADSPASTLSAKPLPAPRYATVTAFSEIRSKPTAAPAQLLYRVQTGTQLIVTSECQEWWGVVMADGSTGWIAKAALQLTDQTITPDQLNLMLQGARPDVVKEAFRYLGTPYRYGGRLPYDVDCSLLVQAAFAARGIPLPRTAAAQFEVGRRVGYSELLPGDRLYFVSSSGRVNHAGIYIGDGRFIHASSRRRCVAVDSLGDSRYWTRFIGACRS
jgi:cell wall-associated NlpC family hydrolase